MTRTMILTAAILALAAPAFAAGEHEGGHGDAMAVGVPGEAASVDRTIKVSMVETENAEMLFETDDMTFKKEETIRFVITNTGYLDHEFVLDTADENQEHKVLMEEFPEMEHADPNAIRLEPGATGEVVWTFANDGTFEYACLIPGHYDGGMHGPLTVN